jgi:hypothetical protein
MTLYHPAIRVVDAKTNLKLGCRAVHSAPPWPTPEHQSWLPVKVILRTKPSPAAPTKYWTKVLAKYCPELLAILAKYSS